MQAYFWSLSIGCFATLTALLTSPVIARAANSFLLQVEGTLTQDDQSSAEDGRLFDIHEFIGEAGQTVGITLESIDFNTYLVLTNTEGDVLAENDNIGNDNAHSFLRITLPESGSYQVRVFTTNPDFLGNYHLKVVTDDTSAPLLSERASQQVEANRLLLQGNDSLNRSDFSAAQQLWQEALKIYQSIQDFRGEANAVGNLGNIYFRLGEYEQAINAHLKSLELAQSIGHRQGEANALGSLGLVYFGLNQYAKAIEFYQQQLAIT